MTITIITVRIESVVSDFQQQMASEVRHVFERIIAAHRSLRLHDFGFNPIRTRVDPGTGRVYGEAIISERTDELATPMSVVTEDIRLSVMEVVSALSGRGGEQVLAHPWREGQNVKVFSVPCNDCTERMMVTDRAAIIQQLLELNGRAILRHELFIGLSLNDVCLQLILDSLADMGAIKCRDLGAPNIYYSISRSL